MDYNVVIVRFGEMSTKGKNKRDFVFRLAHSIRLNLRNYEDDYEMIIRHDHIYLNIKNKIDNLVDILKEISGMYSFSLDIILSERKLSRSFIPYSLNSPIVLS